MKGWAHECVNSDRMNGGKGSMEERAKDLEHDGKLCARMLLKVSANNAVGALPKDAEDFR